jgi:hypothetical protein
MTLTVPLAHLASAKPSAAEASSRKTLNALALAVAKAKRIVVVTGAGISCSSGIPVSRLYFICPAEPTPFILRISARVMGCTTLSSRDTPTSFSKGGIFLTQRFFGMRRRRPCSIPLWPSSRRKSTLPALRPFTIFSQCWTPKGNYFVAILKILTDWKSGLV